MGKNIESQHEQWPHRVAGLKQAVEYPDVPGYQSPGAKMLQKILQDHRGNRPLNAITGVPADADYFLDNNNPHAAWTLQKEKEHGKPLSEFTDEDWAIAGDAPSIKTSRIRVRLAMPMPTNLQLSGDQPDYTGSHGMAVHEDPQGQWSLKQPKPSLGFTVPLEAAAANLQRKVGLEAPESYAITHQGAPAVVSKWYPNSTQAFQRPPRLADLSPDDQMTIQKNHALDWLIGNHDSHVGNWLRTQDGKLVSIDKGQAAKYFGHDRLDPHFHPNYYAREPIYNQLYRDHSQGLGQLHDPRTGELGNFVKQVQSIPDEELKGMFRPYAEAAAKSGLLLNPDGDPSRDLGPRTVAANDPEAFLHALVQRKNNLHNDLGEYHDRMSGGREFVGNRRTAVGEAQGRKLYLPGDVADHLDVPRQTLMTWIHNDETPSPTHTSSAHEEMWDNLDVWNKWYTKRRSLEPGGRGYPEGWSAEFKTDKDPKYMASIPDMSKHMDVPLRDLYQWYYRPKGGKPPPSTHFAVGDDGRGIHLWENAEPLQAWVKHKSGTDHRAASIKTADDGTSLVGWMGWCAYNRKELDRSSLSEYAAISGMDAETYLEIYMFLANNNGIFREAAASGKRLYIPSHIAQHLGVSTPTMVSWLKQQEFPRATHTSNSHSLLWDDPTPWEEFAIRHKALGKEGRTPGWADDLSHQNPIRQLHGIGDIAQSMGLPLNTVYHWYSRPNVKLSPPPSTHYVKGSSGGHDTYLWSNIDPIRNWHAEYKDTDGPGGNKANSYSMTAPARENPLCPDCFTQHAGECL